jgi:DNA-binding IclR family transcriptional regulator
VNILLQLARYWWLRDNPPHPSKTTIAQCIGVDPSTVRRRIARMEAAGFIRRESRYDRTSGRQETNTYHFDGLIKEATPFAQEVIATREQRRAEDAARRSRKKPRLVIMDPTTPPTEAGG